MNKEEKEVLYQRYIKSGLSPKEFAIGKTISSAIIRGLISFHKRIDAGEQSGFIALLTKEKEKQASKSISFKLDNHLIEIDLSLLVAFLGALS